ncbi:hypothetical protein [Brevundimonas sp.]|uniref:hypothetical protein n=1 Tax=Brevundimonas sp. TaxID=1871086 RepID=UPI00289DA7E2|nr:hypothetical protein [Brevundimonas sp.]
MQPSSTPGDQTPSTGKRSARVQAVETRGSGRLTVAMLAGLSILLWALIAGGVYLIVRILL